MFISRELEPLLRKGLSSGKVIVLFGARQTGKTTLVRHMLKEHDIKVQGVLSFNGDDPAHRGILEYRKFSLDVFRRMIGSAKTIFIDEAQNIEGIGRTLKLLYDSMPERSIIVTGSSSFELSGQVGEPLVGRKFEFELHPVSFGELSRHYSVMEERGLLDTRIVYGSYPEIVAADNLADAAHRLKELCGGYLYKDILAWKSVKGPVVLAKLLKALALQIGSEVSFNEIARLIGIDKEAVERYVNLLEKCYVCLTVPSFARNARNELKKSKKIYFRDCGIRNGVLGNFLPLDSRDDVGRLWENYLVCERMKTLSRQTVSPQCYFWRNTAQAEIDWVEESAEKGLCAYEFKWGRGTKARCPEAFRKAYPEASWTCITRENYDTFAAGEI
ncbi:MAG: ATP-binding protein [Kiritimatiellae bacterium]|nr:ATP-binding protein [Kiritimatiellia bacterium]